MIYPGLSSPPCRALRTGLGFISGLLLPMLTSLPSRSADHYAAVLPRLEAVVRQKMAEWDLSGLALALVDGDQIVHSAGYGSARKDSIFRAGSISKLFTALAVMQEVEAGRLHPDAPLSSGVSPVNPYPDQPPVTLRQLLSHRSGFQREPAIGHYFDATAPGTGPTAKSVSGCVLASRPAAKTRYSNAGSTVAGWLASQSAGQPFEVIQQERFLTPLGMRDSGWTLDRIPRERLAPAVMRVADGRGGWKKIPAPVFDLGTIPAGNLFTTVGDLARFASALLAGGKGLVKAETLAEMWQPQFTTNPTGFGLGFVIGTHGKHRTVGHSGAVYGHSSLLTVLPAEGIAVIVIANEDLVGGRVKRIGDTAVSLMLEAKSPAPAPEAAHTPGEASREAGDLHPLPPEASAMTGHYESSSSWLSLELRGGRLEGQWSGQTLRLQPGGGLSFTAHTRIDEAVPVLFEKDAPGNIPGLTIGSQKFLRVPSTPETEPPLPPGWQQLTGSYGPDFIPVIITRRHGHLYAMTENMTDYRLTPENRFSFALCPGMYTDERIVFLTNPDGSVRGMDFANMILVKNP